jgi:hypothetical protein
MTPELKARLFGQVWGLLDSDQAGERAAALDKLHSLRGKMGWPTFAALLRKLESTVTPEQLESAERNAAQWQLAHDDQLRKNAALAQRNAMLVARIASLRTALWFTRNPTKAAAAVIVIGLCGWQCTSEGAPPDQQPAATTSAKNAARNEVPHTGSTPQTTAPTNAPTTAVDAVLAEVLRRANWREGDTRPFIVVASGAPYWVIVRGTIDRHSRSDPQGHEIIRHCLQLFAAEAVRDGGAFMTPSPYRFGLWMKWPQHGAAECRMPGTGNYQNEKRNDVDFPQTRSQQG